MLARLQMATTVFEFQWKCFALRHGVAVAVLCQTLEQLLDSQN